MAYGSHLCVVEYHVFVNIYLHMYGFRCHYYLNFFNHNKWFQRNTTLVSVYTKHQVINLVSCQSIYLYISCKKKVNNSSSCTFGMLPVFMVFMTINLKDLSFLLLWKFLRWFHIAICFDIECYVTYFILLFNNHLSNNSCIFQDCV